MGWKLLQPTFAGCIPPRWLCAELGLGDTDGVVASVKDSLASLPQQLRQSGFPQLGGNLQSIHETPT